MAISTTYNYKDREIVDIQNLLEAVRFLMLNLILSFIFLFLAVEEIDWKIFSSQKTIKDKVIDRTSWNLNTLFLNLLKI